jgi:hypothetical protein
MCIEEEVGDASSIKIEDKQDFEGEFSKEYFF